MGNILQSVGFTNSKNSENNRWEKSTSNSFGLLLGRPLHAADPPVDDDDEFDDPVERMLKKTGCLEKHYSVQECIADTKDWRKCQKQVQDFKECMEKYKKNTGSAVRVA